MNNFFSKKFFLGLSIFLTSALSAQNISLKIGDPAPELKVKWIKGTPVESLVNNHIYVVEFWATWCGPCKQAMPHLSELAKLYEGKVTFIGVDIGERVMDDKPYESVFPILKEFVSSMGDKMAYNVAMDNNDLYMNTYWMKASGQVGIPATFLIKDGKIIWIGHPMKLDKILEEVLAGSYDMESHAKALNQENDKIMSRLAAIKALRAKVSDAISIKDYTSAIQALDNAMSTIDPMYKIDMYMMKFTTYLDFDVPEAIVFAQKWNLEEPNIGYIVADAITRKDELPKEAYQLAVDLCKEKLLNPNFPKPAIYHLMAQTYFKMSDIDSAISNEEKAIETGNSAIAKGEFKGSININSIKDYQNALVKYKAAKK